ncbi:MAG: hypothetical protein HPY76_07490 [Anaerolineae bacterium]|jgi:VIT1/CCC1 family predicted Fe2+/Mn2+ transporter|nr:hypothetical protein [Anaerolineae bacterium]
MGLSKRLDAARKGYAGHDASLSALAHDPAAIARAYSEEPHSRGASKYLGSMVYGGLDGIITTFAVVSGVVGAELDAGIILILGLANLMGDGFSMGVGAYLSSKSDQEFYARERERESWEVDHFPQAEWQELYELYRSQGYVDEDARTMVDIKFKDRERLVDAMMIEELGLQKDDKKPALEGLVTFLAFVVAGAIPLLLYLLDLLFPFELGSGTAFLLSLALSGLALFGLGAAKTLVTQRAPWRSGMEMLLVGGLAAGVAYAIGALLKGII